MGGDLLIQLFDDRPNWQCRLCGRKKRRYITRSLRITAKPCHSQSDRSVEADASVAVAIAVAISQPALLHSLLHQYVSAPSCMRRFVNKVCLINSVALLLAGQALSNR